MQKQTDAHPQVSLQAKLLLSVEEAAMVLSLGRTVLYDLLMRQEIVSVKVGRARRIPMSALQAYVGHLCEAQKVE